MKGEVTSVTSLAKGKPPAQGIQPHPFVWPNLLDGAPPRRRTQGEGAHATYHGMEPADDVRITYTTIVTVDPGADPESPHDDDVRIDVRVSVQRRPLQELIDWQREAADQWASRRRANLAQRLVRQRQLANRLKAKPAIRAAIGLIRLQAKVGYAGIRWTRAITRSAVELPDKLVTRTQTAATHLSDRFGRRAVLAGLRDPSTLTNEQKGVVFFMSLALLVGTLLLLGNVFTLFYPGGAPVYARMVADGAASVLSILALPIPSEAVLLATSLTYGPFVAFAGSFIGKMVGVWLLYFMGDSLFDTITRATEKRPRLARAVDWIHANANRYGFGLLILVNGIPFVPDVLLYAFALSGMRYRDYMAGIALGTGLKFIALLVSVHLLGPDRVMDFLLNPLG